MSARRTGGKRQDTAIKVSTRRGDILPTILIDGSVAGVWRTSDGGIEAPTFRPLCGDVWAAPLVDARRALVVATPEPH